MASLHSHVPPMPEPGPGAKDNGQLAAWLGLIGYTFLLGTFVAANVYLRGWNAEKFGIAVPANLQNLSYISVLVLIVTGVLLFFGGVQYRNSQYKVFMGVMALAALLYAAYLVLQILLLKGYFSQDAVIGTINGTVTALQIPITLVSLGFIAAVGWYGDSKNGKVLNRLVPGAMAVWMYAVVVGLAVMLITNVVTVSEFADWCGTRLTELVK